MKTCRLKPLMFSDAMPYYFSFCCCGALVVHALLPLSSSLVTDNLFPCGLGAKSLSIYFSSELTPLVVGPLEGVREVNEYRHEGRPHQISLWTTDCA